ncbi:MAG: DNA mismatch repair protein MutS [Proteobacteria bacterium SG_bin7]|nr:MAG: DNA mismatch repair protein MutS [Proteobacteria bacterium SG_bin7]
MEKLTPLMQQYWAIKSAHPDQILFFRMGDFFELFHDDARTAAPILNIALTSRNKKNADETAMCGVPHHSVAGPINKLLSEGFRVAICDQVEDASIAKGIVKRAVTRILSPGMVYDPDTLEGQRPNYLCSFDTETVSFFEATTGDAFYFKTCESQEIDKLISILNPTEIVLKKKNEQKFSGTLVTEYDASSSPIFSDKRWEKSPLSAKTLLAYAVFMQGQDILESVLRFEERSLNSHLELSSTVVRHLEIFNTYDGSIKGSLFSAIDRTKTSCGARVLRSWLRFPLVDIEKIKARADRVSRWHSLGYEVKRLREELINIGDLERRLGKVTSPSCNPRDLQNVAASLEAAVNVAKLSEGEISEKLAEKAFAVATVLRSAIVDEPPAAVSKGGVFRRGFDSELDEFIKLTDESEKCIFEVEAREKEETAIGSLKIRFNNVFGYYIEVTKTHLSKVPKHYIRRQTTANGERYITEELQNLESKILSARSKRLELEFELFTKLKRNIISELRDLLTLAKEIAELDTILSLAYLAQERSYARPEISSDGRELKLTASRHPVVEQNSSEVFITNDISLDFGNCMLLTGPNMAGKSTLMRQVAVSALLAQIGSFVPAKKARLPIFHKMFTRIGASDSLSQGLSTFMVEMSETAEMLKSADSKSLVVLDEIGRGTSTYDGLSLAQSILEHLLTKSHAMIFFATHYHELTSLDSEFKSVKNFHMSIHEDKNLMRFLYLLRSGAASKSYGIEVAKLAGLPASVTSRARSLLKNLETKSPKESQLSLGSFEYVSEPNPLKEELRKINILTMTPLEALNRISQWQKNIS